MLYIYATRILISWELPIGWVSWLIVALMTVCIAVQFGLYPTRFKEGKRFDNWITRWMPVLILPLLLLMTIGIIRRFNDYGITINRLYLATLNGWFYIVCIGLFVIKARRYQLDTHFVCRYLFADIGIARQLCRHYKEYDS